MERIGQKYVPVRSQGGGSLLNTCRAATVEKTPIADNSEYTIDSQLMRFAGSALSNSFRDSWMNELSWKVISYSNRNYYSEERDNPGNLQRADIFPACLLVPLVLGCFMPCVSDNYWTVFQRRSHCSKRQLRKVKCLFGVLASGRKLRDRSLDDSNRCYGYEMVGKVKNVGYGGWVDAVNYVITMAKAVNRKARLLMTARNNQSVKNTCYFINAEGVAPDVMNFNLLSTRAMNGLVNNIVGNFGNTRPNSANQTASSSETSNSSQVDDYEEEDEEEVSARNDSYPNYGSVQEVSAPEESQCPVIESEQGILGVLRSLVSDPVPAITPTEDTGPRNAITERTEGQKARLQSLIDQIGAIVEEYIGDEEKKREFIEKTENLGNELIRHFESLEAEENENNLNNETVINSNGTDDSDDYDYDDYSEESDYQFIRGNNLKLKVPEDKSELNLEDKTLQVAPQTSTTTQPAPSFISHEGHKRPKCQIF